MKIVCISDTHNRHKEIDCGSGDILLHAGDATGRGQSGEIKPFLKWFGEQDFAYKILIAGNHDWGFEKEPGRYEKMCKERGVIYLNDSGTTIKDFDTGEEIKIWGSPVQPEFCNWAFNRSIEPADERYPQIKPHWDMIPDDTDILITHGPPWGIRDKVPIHAHISGSMEHVGCPHLLNAVQRAMPKLHVFGHIHEEHGVTLPVFDDMDDTTFVNASQLDDRYIVTYKPVEITWQDGPKNK
jgi:hypothetical protein